MTEDPGPPGELAKPEVQVRKAWRLGETVTGTIAGVGPENDVVVMLGYAVTAEDGGEKARDERPVVARVAGTERSFSLPIPASGPCTHRSPKLEIGWSVGARVVRGGTEGPARWMVITVAPAARRGRTSGATTA